MHSFVFIPILCLKYLWFHLLIFRSLSSFLFCLQIKVSVQITPTLTFSFPFSSAAAISVSISFQISQETSLSLSKSVHVSEEKKVRHGPLFSVREGLSSFSSRKKISALQKLREKKIAQGEPWGRSLLSRSYV